MRMAYVYHRKKDLNQLSDPDIPKLLTLVLTGMDLSYTCYLARAYSFPELKVGYGFITTATTSEASKKFASTERYLVSSFSQHLIDRQQEIDQALTTYLEREMELQTTSFDVEEFLKFHHLRALLHSVIDKCPDRDGFPAELIERLHEDSAPATKDDLQLLRAI